jgi:xylulokinase
MAGKLYLAFDVGTTSVKTALYDAEGRLVHKVIGNYPIENPKPGWCEVNPEVYWNAVREGFREILGQPGVRSVDIVSVAGCSQGETVIFLDRDGRPVRNAIVWIDTRTVEETAEIASWAEPEELYRLTGLPELTTISSAPKILWVKKHEAEVFSRTAKIMLVEDFIAYRLTGAFTGSASLLSTSARVDINGMRYWDLTVDALGIRGMLPEIVEEGSFLGKILPAVADEIGLPAELKVYKGSMDQNFSAVGSGNIGPGLITETTGSALVLAICTERVDIRPGLSLPFQPHAVPGAYLFMPYAQTAGIVFKWFRDEFGAEEIRERGNPEAAYDALCALASSVPAGCDGALFLPFLSGASVPRNNPDARGVLYGLTLKHGRAHFTRAILESIGYMLKDILRHVESSGIPIREIHAMGGGARSDLWLSIKADITGVPIVRMNESETSTLGSAVIQAVKDGAYTSLAEAVAAMVRLGERFEPDPENRAVYDEGYRLYETMYAKLFA